MAPLQTGWLKTGGQWYWLNPDNNGRMAKGWTQVDGKWYYLNGSGADAVRRLDETREDLVLSEQLRRYGRGMEEDQGNLVLSLSLEAAL